jgi:circadian clock protein KaiB
MVITKSKITLIDASSTGARVAKLKTTVWDMRLYIAGETPRSIAAISTLRGLCEKHLPGIYRLEIIDLMKHPELARSDQIVVVPTLVRKLPPPIRKLIGDLSSVARVLHGLEIAQLSTINGSVAVKHRAVPWVSRK